jgi:hypothetical protein
MDIITSIKSAIDLARKAWSIADAMKNVELTASIAQLSENLVDAQLKATDLKSEILTLREQNAHLNEELKKAKATVPEVVVKDGLYYKHDGDGPFCTTCYDNNTKLIRLTEMGQVYRDIGRWRCGVCTTKYGGAR